MKSLLQAVVAVAALILTGCLPPVEDKTPKVYDVDAIVNDVALTSEEKAERIALIGEALFTPASFMYSAELSQLALKFDKSNLRARLYQRLASPLLVTQGAIGRMKPLANRFTQETRESYSRLESDLKQFPAIAKFYLTGGAPITTEAEAQQLLEDVTFRFNDIRLFVRDIQNEQIELHAIVPYMDDGLNAYWRTCTVDLGAARSGYHSNYTVNPCPYHGKKTASLNVGDFVVVQHMTSGAVLSMILGNAYSATGAVEYERFIASNKDASTQDHVTFLNKLSKIGEIRSQKNRAMIKNIQMLGSDLYEGARWADRYQSTLCPKGWNKEQRQGMLFLRGICTGDYPNPKAPKADVVFRSLHAAVTGGALAVMVSGGRFYTTELSQQETAWADYTTHAVYFAPILNPIENLKSQLPTQFDRSGNAINIGDATAGGIFPAGDGNRVAKEMGLILK